MKKILVVFFLLSSLFFPGFITLAQSDEYNVVNLATPPELSGMVRAINNSGDVVGRIGTEFNTGTHGVVWRGDAQLQALAALPGGDFSEAVSINDLGDVVGSSNTQTNLRAVVWARSGEMRDLGSLPGDSGGQATSINRGREVVGSSIGPNGVSAFLWTERKGMQRLRLLPGSDFSEATSINNAGLIAGTSGIARGGHRAVLWENAAIVKELGVLPGDSGSESYAINNLGHVVGASSGPSGIHAFIWTHKDGMSNLGSLGGNFSMAFGINSLGDVVGISTVTVDLDCDCASHAFIWTSGSGMRDLNDLIPTDSQILLVAAVGINDRGQIIAYGGNRDTFDHDTPISVYLLTPKGR